MSSLTTLKGNIISKISDKLLPLGYKFSKNTTQFTLNTGKFTNIISFYFRQKKYCYLVNVHVTILSNEIASMLKDYIGNEGKYSAGIGENISDIMGIDLLFCYHIQQNNDFLLLEACVDHCLIYFSNNSNIIKILDTILSDIRGGKNDAPHTAITALASAIIIKEENTAKEIVELIAKKYSWVLKSEEEKHLYLKRSYQDFLFLAKNANFDSIVDIN